MEKTDSIFKKLPDMNSILIRYGEIALKGGNRGFFENKLRNNISHTLGIKSSRVINHRSQLQILATPDEIETFCEKLLKVFGISWFSPGYFIQNNLEQTVNLCERIGKEIINPDNSFAIKATRSFKDVGYDSQDIGIKCGSAVNIATNAKVNLSNPDVTIYVNVSKEGTYILTKRIDGLKGMPVGTSNRMISLLSGGFDSIASSYMLAKRGAKVDFLHFHVYTDKEKVMESKIPHIVKKLSESTLTRKLIMSSYIPFEMKVLGFDKTSHRYEMVLFRRLIAKIAERYAIENNYSAIIFGDSLGQVASQTMENLAAVVDAVRIPIFRPLIGFDKVEVIDLVRNFGLYQEASAPYKDCCSIVSPRPITKARLPIIHEMEKKLNMPEIIDQMMEEIEFELI